MLTTRRPSMASISGPARSSALASGKQWRCTTRPCMQWPFGVPPCLPHRLPFTVLEPLHPGAMIATALRHPGHYGVVPALEAAVRTALPSMRICMQISHEVIRVTCCAFYFGCSCVAQGAAAAGAGAGAAGQLLRGALHGAHRQRARRALPAGAALQPGAGHLRCWCATFLLDPTFGPLCYSSL